MDDLPGLTRTLNDPAGFPQAFQALYPELRRIAVARGQGQGQGQSTLTPTALVGELYLRWTEGGSPPSMQSTRHFLAMAARSMRWIMVDHARRRLSGKRGGDLIEVTLIDELPQHSSDQMVLALHDALDDLKSFAPRQHDIVELHYFGGLGFEQIAGMLDCHERTVRREWSRARAFLHVQLNDQPGIGGDVA